MLFPTPLVRGRLIKRYKRFLADVLLDSGEEVTATCPNTGSMRGLTEPGSVVWLSISDSATRKYKHTWEMIENDVGSGPTLVGINTNHPNRLLSEAIAERRIAPLAGYATARREQKYGRNSRIDILLEDDPAMTGAKPACYVEIKNVHMMRKPGLAEFPDTVTERGAKHLGELADMVREGKRAVMVFLVQRADAKSIKLARDVDPAYGAAFDLAVAAGVEAIAVRCRLAPSAIEIDRLIKISEIGLSG